MRETSFKVAPFNINKAWQKCISAVLAIVLCATMLPAQALAATQSPQASQGTQPDSDGLIIVYEDDFAETRTTDEGVEVRSVPSENENVKELDEMGVQVENTMPADFIDEGTLVSAKVPEGMSTEQAIEEISALPRVKSVMRNIRLQPVEPVQPEEAKASRGGKVSAFSSANSYAYPDDPSFSSQYYLQGSTNTHLAEAWNNSALSSSSNVVVAVIDSGCWFTHEDLQANVLTEYARDVANEKDEKMTLPMDARGDSHGTHVSGIIGAITNNGKGIAGGANNKVSVLPINVFYYEPEVGRVVANLDDVIYAIYKLAGYIDQGVNIRVLNMSLGHTLEEGEEWWPEDSFLKEAISYLRSKGALSVVAAGNNEGTKRTFPSDFDECLSVMAVDKDGRNASYSNHNQYKDISAPGSEIYSTLQGDYSYGYLTGTSQASPLVAATAALICAAVPSITPDEVEQVIKNTAGPITGNTAGYSGSAGTVNANAAINAATNRAIYKVEHYKQTNTGYSMAYIETLSGAVGCKITASPRSYVGFHPRSEVSGVVKADGSLVLKVYYDWNTLTVKFYANGGAGSMADQQVFYDQAVKLTPNKFTRKGYKFLGWNTDPNATSVKYSDEQSIFHRLSGDGILRLYAVWQVDPSQQKQESVEKKAPKITYSTKAQGKGWKKAVASGKTSGSASKSGNIEALKVSLNLGGYSGKIQYRAMVQSKGWQSWKTSGKTSGTVDKKKRLEALKIKLSGEVSKHYDVYYRVYSQKFGWMGWAKNGASAGTSKYGYRIGAVQIKLVAKGDKAPTSKAKAFRQK